MLEALTAIVWLPIAMIVFGVILVIVEMFIPGFGVPGTLGIILLIAGIGLQAKSLMEAILLVIIVLAVLGVALAFALHSATKGIISRTPLILKARLNREQGFRSTEDMEVFLGKVGRTLTTLRPTGSADFDGVKLDVVSDGEYIEPGCPVEITKVEGRRILVRALAEEQA